MRSGRIVFETKVCSREGKPPDECPLQSASGGRARSVGVKLFELRAGFLSRIPTLDLSGSLLASFNLHWVCADKI